MSRFLRWRRTNRQVTALLGRVYFDRRLVFRGEPDSRIAVQEGSRRDWVTTVAQSEATYGSGVLPRARQADRTYLQP